MYCQECGSKLNGGENFCPGCGKAVHEMNTPKRKQEYETLEFSSSILLGGSILTPDKIIITKTEVIYRKRNKYLIGTDESSIPFSRISSVEVDRKLIDSDIIIYSTGNQKIVVQDFSISSAKEIKREIENRMNN